jgi:hypothetical protein
MRFVVAILSALLVQVAVAQPAKRDGTWLKDGLDATDRVWVSKTPTEQEAISSIALTSYIYGMLAVHRQNNLKAVLLAGMVESKGGKSVSDVDNARLRTAFMFVPLLKIPDELSAQQVAAILRKFLADNPARWNESADTLITDAFESAFAVINKGK